MYLYLYVLYFALKRKKKSFIKQIFIMCTYNVWRHRSGWQKYCREQDRFPVLKIMQKAWQQRRNYINNISQAVIHVMSKIKPDKGGGWRDSSVFERIVKKEPWKGWSVSRHLVDERERRSVPRKEEWMGSRLGDWDGSVWGACRRWGQREG